MKNLIIATMVLISSVSYGQNKFLLSGKSLNTTDDITYAVLYTADTITNTWVHSSTVKIPGSHEIILSTKELYIVDFVNGDVVKSLYINATIPGELALDVDFSSTNNGRVFYSNEDFKYVAIAGTDEEIFD